MGIKFIPPQAPPKFSALMESFNYYHRSINIQSFFHYRSKPDYKEYVPQFYVPNTTWNPPVTATAASYGTLTSADIKRAYDQAITKYASFQNPWYIKTLQDLRLSSSLKLTTADKNLGLVLLTKEQYNVMCLLHLQNTTTYSLMEIQHHREVFDMIKTEFLTLNQRIGLRFQNIKSMDRYLSQFKDFVLPKFYCLPKIHKKGPLSGRPIASAFKHFTTGISAVLSWRLRPMITSDPVILRDTKHFITRLENTVLPANTILVTLDIVALYPNMDQEMTVQAVESELKRAGQTREDIELLKDMTRFTLNNSYVTYNGAVYKQNTGTAMGTNAAPELANIFGQVYVDGSDLFTMARKFQMLWFHRFLDDIIFAWTGTREDLLLFLDDIQRLHPSIKFTAHIGSNSVDFLDITVFNHDGKLMVKPYVKEMNKFLYLPYNSNHPVHTKKGFLKGELIRLLRNSSMREHFNEAKLHFNTHLAARGYPSWFIAPIFARVTFADKAHFSLATAETDSRTDVYFKTQYHPLMIEMGLKQLLTKHWDLLPIKDTHKPLVSYAKQHNLKELAITSDFQLAIDAKEESTELLDQNIWEEPKNPRTIQQWFHLFSQENNQLSRGS